ncbi:tRNA-splicing endonuclease-like protein subunit Sen2 [Lentithecium fluviatile CBS 122367]|uniref:tRNA-splicing endonuclease subunit Sen2 n=1 Tax=Lentithecium fluviatile CBS 122367 TaxID=1168545 RepID=A0A6G1IHF0_9PLEO|nr:tRNA-splicing endonuclease-like protein subunit Sen2 [Lentithecium fluviatile CBS 122367]
MAATVQAQPQNAHLSMGEPILQKQGNSANDVPKKPRVKRPNYNQIHAKPLPVEIHPLPAFIPHNPISIVRIAITLLSHSLWPPSSHTVIHKAYFSPETQSVHVTDPQSIRALWEQGFWGSGSLSRSEPRWLDQEKRKRGIEVAATSEEYTRARREERRQFKLERAKAQREAIEQQLRDEGKLDADASVDQLIEDDIVTESPKGTLYRADGRDSLRHVTTADCTSALDEAKISISEDVPSLDTEIKDQEHLQLTFEETFFLKYVLGALDVLQQHTSLASSELLRLFCAHSEFPYPEATGPRMAPDDPFLLKYIVFHHFRSLGWVVRPGIKFACDYLLYLRGPVFHHAEFAVMILPAYSDPYWISTPERAAACQKKEQKDWWWLHRLNRVQSSVHKTLLLVYVEVPPPWYSDSGDENTKVDIGDALKRYKVREFVWKRWSPNRNRD